LTGPGMEGTPSRILRELQSRHPFRFRRSLSQNFLVDPMALEGIARAVGAGPGDTVLEVGAGAGFLTRELLRSGARVLAVELDPVMAGLLREVTGDHPNLSVIEADILALDITALLDREGVRKCMVAGNLPYHVTTPALFHILATRDRVERMIFTVQREVGVRMAAGPGTKDYGALSLAVAYGGTCERIFGVPAAAFVPRPKVDSVVVRLVPVAGRLHGEVERRFFSVVRAAFGQRRKMLLNSVARAFGGREEAARALAAAGIGKDRRGETLSLEDFIRLAGDAGRGNGGKAG